jgi:hypothetical protein
MNSSARVIDVNEALDLDEDAVSDQTVAALDKAQKEMWNDYCCKVDAELRRTEERVVPNAAVYVVISWVIILPVLLTVLWL